MRWAVLLCGATLVPLGGCANLTSIARTTDIISPWGDSNDAVAIHLDAEQRLVFSDARAICAEPSPDALTALAASAGAGLTGEGPTVASVAQAMQETSASIGLRTQSITLMRDTLYRMCEAYHNSAIDKSDVIQLLQRSQDLTLGVLAIEQLTGVAMAKQVALGGEANSSASANLQSTQEVLNDAERDEEEKRKAKEAAADKVKATEQELAAAEAGDEEAKEKVPDLKKQLERDKEDQQKKTVAHAEAVETVEILKRNRASAYTKAHAAAKGSGEFADPVQAGAALTDASAANITRAVENIVATIVGKSHFLDVCVNYLSKTPPDTGKEMTKIEIERLKGEEARNAFTNKYCGDVITADIEMRKRANQAQSDAYANHFGAPVRNKDGNTVIPHPRPKPSSDKPVPPPSGVY